MNDFIIKKPLIIPYDLIANKIVKFLLNKRDAKRIYSDKELAIEYLSSLTSKEQDRYEMPKGLKLKSKVEKKTLGGFPLYIFTPDKAKKSSKTVLYLHGGGFVNQPDVYHYTAVDKITNASGATVYFFVYPKAPTHSYELTFTLVEELYNNLLKSAEPQDITFMGDSAGAMIALCLTQIFRESGIPMPHQLILFSPVADTELSNPEISKIYPKDPMQGVDGLKEFIKSWANGSDISSPYFNPIALDLGKLPKMTIFSGTNEIFSPDVCIFAQKAHEAGADVTLYLYKGMYHVFPIFNLLAGKISRLVSAKLINS